MNLNAALVLTLLLCTVAGALGFCLGRVLRPKSRSLRKGTGVAGSRADVRPAASPMPESGAARIAPKTPRQAKQTSDDLRRQIESKLEELRRARENAQPWAAPEVDRVGSSGPGDSPGRPMTFADTTIDPEAWPGTKTTERCLWPSTAWSTLPHQVAALKAHP